MSSWKDFFEDYILDRGYAYYDWDHVESIVRIDDTVYATVSGIGDYTVTIRLNRDEIIGMDCSCPHAKEGNNCKHMACVCYYIDNKEIKPVTRQDNRDIFSDTISDEEFTTYLENKVSNTDYEFIMETLIDILRSNDNEFYEFMYLNDNMDDTDRSIYKKRLNNILRQDIDILDSQEFTDKLNDYISNACGNLLLLEEYNLVLDLIEAILTRIASISYVNDTFEFEMIMDDLDKFVEKILEKTGNSHIKRIENIFRKIAENYSDTLFIEKFTQMYKKYVYDDKDTQIKLLVKELENKDDFFKLEKITEIVEIMKQSDATTSDIIEFLEDYLMLYGIENILVPLYLENNQVNDAISLLGDVCEDSSYSPRSINSLKQLKKIYLDMNDEKYVETINTLIYKHNHYSKENIKLLKEYYEDEWPVYEKKILDYYHKHIKHSDSIYYYLLDKEDYEKFKECLLEEADYPTIKHFQQIMIDRYPNELLETYTDIVYRTLETANVKNYKKSVKIIKQMKKIPDSEDRIIQLVNNIKNRYPHRSRLIKELKNI